MSQATNMDWHFPLSDPAGEANINSYSRTVIEGERTISALEIFVREVLQNSLDAAKDPSSKVTVQFRLRTLSGSALNSFFQAINWPSLRTFAVPRAGCPESEWIGIVFLIPRTSSEIRCVF